MCDLCVVRAVRRGAQWLVLAWLAACGVVVYATGWHSSHVCVFRVLCLIAQAQESTPAAWGRGDRARDPIWGGDAVLRWQLDSGTLHKLTQTKPYLHLNVYARSPRGTSYGADTTLGRVVIDLRRTSQTLAGDASADSAATPQWYNLADAAPGEILLSSRLVALQGGGGPSDGAGGSARIVDVPQSLRQSMERVPAVLAPTDADAIVIGAGGPESSLFTLSVSLFSLPSLLPLVRDHAGPFWLSYKLFGILVQVRPCCVRRRRGPVWYRSLAVPVRVC